MTTEAGEFVGQTILEARKRIKEDLNSNRLLLDHQKTNQTVRTHDRCRTPVEYIVTRQWFVNVLDYKDKFLAAGEHMNWYPSHMETRFRDWVQNLSWDWCISRQRFHGVPFPVWYCQNCMSPLLANPDQLPVDPAEISPKSSCHVCGGTAFNPELDVLDTWATSSLTPQIVAHWLSDPYLYEQIYPMTLRPQAHEIIRTWLFYTIVMSMFHFNTIPFKDVLISGWGIAGEGMGKISKSHGGGPKPPMAMLNLYSADALRYWAASGGPGKDLVINEEKIKTGSKLVTKIWNVARFSSQFDTPYQPISEVKETFTLADRWLLNRIQQLIKQVTTLFQEYDYAAAKNEIEKFFWLFADNYIEMAKQRLYDKANPQHQASVYSIHQALVIFIKLFAPFLPHVTEEIYQGMDLGKPNNAENDHEFQSIHNSPWPTPNIQLVNDTADQGGEILLTIATTVRRYKSERKLSIGSEFSRLQLATDEPATRLMLNDGLPDIKSITRAKEIEILPLRKLITTPISIHKNYSIIIEP
jgi:valyl-tRNA synthetase